MKPWLLEVNHSPSFQADSPLDFNLKKNLIRDTLHMLNLSWKRKNKYIHQSRNEKEKRLTDNKKLTNREKQQERELLKAKKLNLKDTFENSNLGDFQNLYPLPLGVRKDWDDTMAMYDSIYFKKSRQVYEESLLGGCVSKPKREEGMFESPPYKKGFVPQSSVGFQQVESKVMSSIKKQPHSTLVKQKEKKEPKSSSMPLGQVSLPPKHEVSLADELAASFFKHEMVATRQFYEKLQSKEESKKAMFEQYYKVRNQHNASPKSQYFLDPSFASHNFVLKRYPAATESGSNTLPFDMPIRLASKLESTSKGSPGNQFDNKLYHKYQLQMQQQQKPVKADDPRLNCLHIPKTPGKAEEQGQMDLTMATTASADFLKKSGYDAQNESLR
mmetsp:Transcript_8661/g.13435  ORF Transcript_8661/g.13435 Transcript_8661/m.13435 type:complete len:386 (+) Transcript_8661:1806-2963(+)